MFDSRCSGVTGLDERDKLLMPETERRTAWALAAHKAVDRSDLGRTLPLAFLAPDMIEAVVA
jgi:hypothetical protein